MFILPASLPGWSDFAPTLRTPEVRSLAASLLEDARESLLVAQNVVLADWTKGQHFPESIREESAEATRVADLEWLAGLPASRPSRAPSYVSVVRAAQLLLRPISRPSRTQ